MSVPERSVPAPPAPSSAQLDAALDAVLDRFLLPGPFPAPVLAEAEHAAATVRPPERDLRAVPFCTIDPPASTDLDQAMHLQRSGSGVLLRYAIAAVDHFVRPGGAIDAEARRRGQTVYAPNRRIPLHPVSLSEGAASLLPDQDRPAYVWELRLDADGEVLSRAVFPALVRSRAKLSYAGAQRLIDSGAAPESLALLPAVGRQRAERELARGGASLRLPESEIERDEGGYRLRRRRPLPVEDWNSQLSLATGMAAAELMIEAGVGVLRTMPPPDAASVELFRARARALGAPWPAGQAYGEYLRGIDTDDPRGLAAMHAAGSLFRGAGYTAFDGEPPEHRSQAAVAAPYTHVTAPLRRLVDRFALATCAALSAGRPVPEWAREALPQLPKVMAVSGQRANGVARAAVDLLEVWELADRVGERFEAVVLSASAGHGTVQLLDSPVTADCVGELTAGERISAVLERADLGEGRVAFRHVDAVPSPAIAETGR